MTGSGTERILTGICGLLGLLSVASLLAWAYRLGRFDLWFLAVGAPAILLLIAIGVWVTRMGRYPRLRAALITGVIGGLLGTIGYDLFRIPFAAAGLRLFAPIESYGVLLVNADSSSPWTDLAGWSYHFANGIGFGVFYAALALGRRWWWGIAWGMVLETGTLITPFATTYAIAGQWDLIAIAYAAHVAYGYPLGRVVQSGRAFADSALEVSRRPIVWTLVALASFLLIWHRPFVIPGDVRARHPVAQGPSAVVVEGRFVPEWLRVASGGCVVLRNDDESAYTVDAASNKPVLKTGKTERVCFDEVGVHRVRISNTPYSGGFVIVDPALAR